MSKKLNYVNEHMDITNLARRDEFRKVVKQTTGILSQLLADSCGRSSRYCLVIAPETATLDGKTLQLDGKQVHIFSRDGAHLLNHTTFASPIQTYIKSMLGYLSDRVDHSCGDGTTTAAIMGAAFLHGMSDIMDSFPEVYDHPTMTEFVETYSNVTKEVLSILGDSAITIDSLMEEFDLTEAEAMERLVWVQSFTSADGDSYMADKMAHAFSHMPREYALTLDHEAQSVESEEQVHVNIDDAQYVMENPMYKTWDLLNMDFGSGYDSGEGVDMINFPYELQDDSPITNKLFEYLDTLEEGDKFIVAATSVTTESVAIRIEQLNKLKGTEIMFMLYGAEVGRSNRFSPKAIALNAIANVPTFFYNEEFDDPINHFEDSIIRGIHLVGYHKVARLYNIYEDTNEDFMGHPYILDEDKSDHKFYHEFRDGFYKMRDRIVGEHKKDAHELAIINEGIQYLEIKHRVSILAGGRTFEQTANRLKLEDTIKASISSIRDGVINNGPARLMAILEDMLYCIGMFALKKDENDVLNTFAMPREKTVRGVTEEYTKVTIEMIEDLKDPIEFLILAALHYAAATITNYSFKRGAPSAYIGTGELFTHQFLTSENPIESEALQDPNSKLVDKYELMDGEDDWKLTTDEMKENPRRVPPVQSVRVFDELLVRIREIILPVALSNNVITSDELWEEDKAADKRKKKKDNEPCLNQNW